MVFLDRRSLATRVFPLEIWQTWETGDCGEGSLQGLVMWAKVEGAYAPQRGFPEEMQLGKDYGWLEVRSDSVGVHMKSALINRYYTDVTFRDIGGDETPEILFRYFDPDDGQCRKCVHKWTLKVFEYKDGFWRVASWWNGGATYSDTELRMTDNEDGRYFLRLFQELAK